MSRLGLRIGLAYALLWLSGVLIAVLAGVLDGGVQQAAVVAGVAMLTLLLGQAMGAWLDRRLAEITAAARAVSGGNLVVRVRDHGRDELAVAGAAFDAMASTVQAQVDAAAQERNRLAAALNSSIDAVAALDSEGRVLFANTALARLFEKRAAEVAGHPLVWLVPDEQVLTAIRATRELTRREIRVIEMQGRRFFQVATTPIVGGGEWSVLVVFHDITDVKRTELVRRDFVANVSHELRTPLAALKAVVETLSDGAATDPRVAKEFLDRADSEVDRLVQLVEELLQLSRIESGDVPIEARPTNIEALLDGVLQRLRPQVDRKRQDLRLAVSPELGEVSVDAGRIELAVLNLVQNAIKFTPDGGSVAVSAAREDDALTIEVADTGIGMTAQEQSRVFERFYKVDQSRASGGSGLGLALVKHAVEAHGGEVRVESRLGEGSRFSFSIPLATKPD